MNNILKQYIKENLSFLSEGRKERYIDMFKEIIKLNPKFKEPIESRIKDAIDSLKKDDRIIWYLVRLRMVYINDILQSTFGEEYYFVLNLEKKLKSKVNEENSVIENIDNIFETLKHFFSLPIPEIQNFVMGNNKYWDIQEKFSMWENKWKEKTKGKIKTSEYEGKDWKPLIEFPDGKVWILLNQSSCSIEARAMGHCGNAGNPRSGERILSLRTLKNDHWEVHLTFILDNDGFLGEMKGRGNEKPAAHYYPYIIKLLEDPIIKGIKGGGYLASHNFSIDDLPDNIKEKLIKMKPSLLNVDDYKWALEKYGEEIPEDDAYLQKMLKSLNNAVSWEDSHVVLSKENKKYAIWTIDNKEGLKFILINRMNDASVSRLRESEEEAKIDYFLNKNTKKLKLYFSSSLLRYPSMNVKLINDILENFYVRENIEKKKIIYVFAEALSISPKIHKKIQEQITSWMERNHIIFDGEKVITRINLFDLIERNGLSLENMKHWDIKTIVPYGLISFDYDMGNSDFNLYDLSNVDPEQFQELLDNMLY